MGFLDRILGRAKDKFDGKGSDSHKGNTTTEIRNENCNRILVLQDTIEKLLERTGYIAKSDYADIYSQYTEVIDFFGVLQKGGVLSDFCRANRVLWSL